jgi:UDP-GlcNAc3NAcA epimerase
VRVLSVVGARPQFMKAAPVASALAASHQHLLVHTGQHYDTNMSDVFFEELGLPEADFNLGIGSGSHAAQTGAMLMALEAAINETRPDWVIIYGDTNSTLAGAIAASKLWIRVAHVEAGLRSFNRAMPEEINRIVADRVSDILLCPSQLAVDNLRREGMVKHVHLVGDVMGDALQLLARRARARSTVLERLSIARGGFVLATIHRAENTDDRTRMTAIVEAIGSVGEPVVWPLHPRTRKLLAAAGVKPGSNVRTIDPVGYLDMLQLAQNARVIVTDSGGLQKEAYWLGVPCVTARDETEWVETVDAGWNVVTGADRPRIIEAVRAAQRPAQRPPLYGDGHAAARIVALLEGAD